MCFGDVLPPPLPLPLPPPLCPPHPLISALSCVVVAYGQEKQQQCVYMFFLRKCLHSYLNRYCSRLFMLMLGLFVFSCYRNRTTLKVNYLQDIYKKNNSRASTHVLLDIVSAFATKSLNSVAWNISSSFSVTTLIADMLILLPIVTA